MDSAASGKQNVSSAAVSESECVEGGGRGLFAEGKENNAKLDCVSLTETNAPESVASSVSLLSSSVSSLVQHFPPPSDWKVSRSSGGGRYFLGDAFLGQGTYGRVEKAWDSMRGRFVAIKKVHAAGGSAGGSSGPVSGSEASTTAFRKQWMRQSVGQVGLHFTCVRELKVMREVQQRNSDPIEQRASECAWDEHSHLMALDDVFVEGSSICLVMQLMRGDLKKVLESRVRLHEAHVKCLMRQLLIALKCLHSHYLLHRDLSPANVFVAPRGICRVADFGLAREFGNVGPVPAAATALAKAQLCRRRRRQKAAAGRDGSASSITQNSIPGSSRRDLMTPKVVTLWYRAPELLWGADRYGDKVDVWSIGCIFYELLSGRVLFPGLNDVDQLSKILTLLGTPQPQTTSAAKSSEGRGEEKDGANAKALNSRFPCWSGVDALPSFFGFTATSKTSLRKLLPFCAASALDLLEKMLQLDPNKRISAAEALEHGWFKEAPSACAPHELPFASDD